MATFLFALTVSSAPTQNAQEYNPQDLLNTMKEFQDKVIKDHEASNLKFKFDMDCESEEQIRKGMAHHQSGLQKINDIAIKQKEKETKELQDQIELRDRNTQSRPQQQAQGQPPFQGNTGNVRLEMELVC
jgi:hypothetical protein